MIAERACFREVLDRLLLVLGGTLFLLALGAAYRASASAQGAPLWIPLAMVPLMVGHTLPYFLPVALMTAVSLTYGRMVAEGEHVALLAAGSSPMRLLGPAWMAGILAALVSFPLLSGVLPGLYSKTKDLLHRTRFAALENPDIPDDVLMRLMGRRGGAKRPGPAFPEIGEAAERMLGFMTNVLVVEVIAEETFRWGIDVLSDPEVSAAPEVAGAMVRNIQADEKPHVDYLRTALSEVAARTLNTVDGKQIAGKTVIDGLLHRTLSQMLRNRPSDQRDDVRNGLRQAMQSVQNPAALQDDFDALEPVWTAPEKTGFEPASLGA